MQSIWMAETKIRERQPLPADLKAEAVVIGAGLAGILTAYYLKQAGVQAVVLEADRIGSGQTKNTTAKITSQHSLIYSRLVRVFGSDLARQYAQANEKAIKEYERLTREKRIDCDFVRCPACLYSCTREKILKEEVERAGELGIAAFFEKDCELPFPVAGVARFEGQARFQPLKFLQAIAEEVEIYEQTRVLKVEGQRVETARGAVTAEHIIFVSHYPFINVPGYYFARMYQERSYVVALQGASLPEGMYLGIDENGLSFRAQGGTLLFGGGSHRSGLNRQGGQYEMLLDLARVFYPGSCETGRWSAQDCMTLDGVPYIGRFSRRRPRWYVATGFGKWGMTSAMVSARILTDLITHRECQDADIFSPQRRFTLCGARELLVHGGHTVKGLAKHLLPTGKAREIPNCPHMGCRLEWNPEEGSYDCPCHGSRFDGEGRLIDGPAQTDCPRRKK